VQHSLLQVTLDGHARAYREENWLMADHSLGLEKFGTAMWRRLHKAPQVQERIKAL